MIIGALNHLIAGAPWARARLIPFAGRRARLETPLLTIAFAVTADGRLQAIAPDETPDVAIRLPEDALFECPPRLEKLIGEAHVEGNAEFATALSFVFRHLQWDVEEDLSRFVGDIAAHRLVYAASRCADSLQRARANFFENLAEYLVYEKRVLADSAEFAQLRADIAQLDSDLARIERRLSSLRR
jgi:ubiquinone biosynthesis protein UbiJ